MCDEYKVQIHSSLPWVLDVSRWMGCASIEMANGNTKMYIPLILLGISSYIYIHRHKHKSIDTSMYIYMVYTYMNTNIYI